MARDPLSGIFENWTPIAPRLSVAALDERELLPTALQDVKSFSAEYVDGDRIDREGALGSDLLARAAERGWFGLTIPEAHGGAGLSLAAATSIVSELAAHNGSLGTCIGLHSGLALHALLHAAPARLQERYLPEVATGQRIAAFAATEPGAGSDISGVRTIVTEVDGQLRLTGAKCYVTNGGLCGVLTVLARSPGLGGARAGHTLVLVDPNWPGVTRSIEEHKLGLKGSSTVTIDFEDVEIPEGHVLGEVSKGLEQAHEALCWGRTFMAAGCLGSARATWEIASEHTRTRQQFGRPLIGFPLVREALAEARAELYAMESALRLVCALSDTKSGELALTSSMLKVLASDGAWRVADTSLQLMGGAGYMEDNGVARRLRDIRVTRIFEGANDVLRVSLGSACLAWPSAHLQRWSLPRHQTESWANEARQFDESCKSVVDAIQRMKRRWGFRLFEQQARAAALADALIALFAALSVLGRVTGARDESLLKGAPSDSGLAEGPLARLAIRRQLQRVGAGVTRALASEDVEITALIDQVSEYEAGVSDRAE